MMQHPAGRRVLALIAALALATAGSAFAQDTTEVGGAPIDTTQPAAGALDTAGVDTLSDTTDTSGVQNPPGYRGMERDTTMFPAKGGPPATPEEAAGQTTGKYSDSAWRDTSGAKQNPPGYRGMERPVGEDSAAGHDTTQHDTGAGDTTAQTPDTAQ